MIRDDLIEAYTLRAVDRNGDGRTSWSMALSIFMSTQGSINPDGSVNQNPPAISRDGGNVAWLDLQSSVKFSSIAKIDNTGKKIYVNTYSMTASPREFFLSSEMELEKLGIQDLSLRNQYISNGQGSIADGVRYADLYLPKLSNLILKATFSNDTVFNDNMQRWDSQAVNVFANPMMRVL